MTFPSDFVWGVSAAAYQIEGAAEAGGRAPSVWDEFCERPGAVFDGHSGQVACDHFHRYAEDIALMAQLGVRAYRMSIAWPRILPEGAGRPLDAGLDFYERVIDALLERGIEPWVTLYHWDLPLALHQRGGWQNRDVAQWFENYTIAVAQRLGDRVTHWITLNEPQVFVEAGYATGVHAPGERLGTPELVRVAHHCLLAHGRAVAALRAHTQQPAQIGWALTGIFPYPAETETQHIDAARAAFWDVRGERWLAGVAWYAEPALRGQYPAAGLPELEQHLPAGWQADLADINQPLDFIGINSYQGRPTRADAAGAPATVVRAPGFPQTMLHWPVDPRALEWGIRFVHERYGLPIYVTENGCAGMDWVHADGKVHDAARIDFLTRYLVGVRDAIAAGADVRGYFHWSILDNFEWSAGYPMRFGLVYVHYPTLKRTPKDSFEWYRKLIATHGEPLPAEVPPLY
jgi:beta-glucosidase